MCLKSDPLMSFITGIHIVSTFLMFTLDFALLQKKVEDIGLDGIWTGIILGTFSIPTLALAFVFNKMVHKFGRRCIYMHGLLWVFGGSFLFGTIQYIENQAAFVFVAIMGRLALGFGAFQTKTIIYSIAGKRYPKNVDMIYTFVFIGINIGIGGGPFIGSLIYEPLDSNIFVTHVIVIAVIASIFIPTAIVMLKQKKEGNDGDGGGGNKGNESKSLGLRRIKTTVQEKVVPFCQVLKNMKTISLYLVVFWHIFYQLFWVTRLYDQFKDVYGRSNTLIAFTYLLRSICVVPFAFIAPIVIKKYGRVISIFFGSLLHLLGFFVFGPPTWFGDNVENGYIFTMISIGVKGVADPFMFVPLFAQIIEDFQKRHIAFRRFFGAVSDVVSAFGNLVIESAIISASVISGIPKSSHDYRVMGQICFWAQVPIFVFFLIFGGVCKAFRECRQRSSKVHDENKKITIVKRNQNHERQASQTDLIVNNDKRQIDQIQQSKFSEQFSAFSIQEEDNNNNDNDDVNNG